MRTVFPIDLCVTGSLNLQGPALLPCLSNVAGIVRAYSNYTLRATVTRNATNFNKIW